MYILRHSRGELGPKTIDEWAAPNGTECLLIWMLREIGKHGETAELIQTEPGPTEDYYTEVRP